MNIETERLNDMFGSIGNLHMLVFEILFKNPHLLQPSAMLELGKDSISKLYISSNLKDVDNLLQFLSHIKIETISEWGLRIRNWEVLFLIEPIF